MDDFIKSVETPEEAIQVFNQLQPLLSQHGFELKKWISNNDEVTEAIPEDLKSISNTKQVEVEPSTEGSSVLVLQWTVTDDSLQVCRGTNKKMETPITQRKILSLVSSVFDPIGLFAPFSVHMRRLLKGIWTKIGKHWDNEVEPSEEEEFLRWKEQLPIVAETSIDRRYFNRERDKAELHVFADASEDTMCCGLSTLTTKRILSWLSICHWKMQSSTDEASFNTAIGIASGSHGSEVERTDSQGTWNEDK